MENKINSKHITEPYLRFDQMRYLFKRNL